MFEFRNGALHAESAPLEAIAREYAALRSPDTETAEPHDWRDHSSSPHHHDGDDPEPIWDKPDTETVPDPEPFGILTESDTETAGEAG